MSIPAPAPAPGTRSFNLTSFTLVSGGIVTCIGLAIVLFIYSATTTSALIGSTENWRAIQPQITRIWWQTGMGALILFGALFLYAIHYSASSAIFTLLISCISLGLSYSAISMAAISTTGPVPTA